MNGTLALWYEPLNDGGGAGDEKIGSPNLELHLNLWRDLESNTNFLDIGFQITNLSNLKRFHLYFPSSIDHEDIKDLSTVLKYGPTLNSVFNSVIDIERNEDNFYTIVKNSQPFASIHHVSIGKDKDLWVEEQENDDRTVGSLVVFSDKLCERLRKNGQKPNRAASPSTPFEYIRIRIDLNSDSKELFSKEIRSSDGWLASTWGRLELTEFRLNEKRSYPSQISDANTQKAQFNISKIHYFLIRDLRHQLVLQHQDFKKVRRLEGKLWRHYLVGDVSRIKAERYEKTAERMVIYHWEKSSKGEAGVEDFLAFASFSSGRKNIFFYVLIVLVFGAMGSLLATFLSDFLSYYLQQLRLENDWNISTDTIKSSTAVLAFFAIPFFAAILYCVVRIVRFALTFSIGLFKLGYRWCGATISKFRNRSKGEME